MLTEQLQQLEQTLWQTADTLRDNATRTDFAQRFQAIIDEYNSGGASTENYFEELLKFKPLRRYSCRTGTKKAKSTCDRTFELIYEYASKGTKWSA